MFSCRGSRATDFLLMLPGGELGEFSSSTLAIGALKREVEGGVVLRTGAGLAAGVAAGEGEELRLRFAPKANFPIELRRPLGLGFGGKTGAVTAAFGGGTGGGDGEGEPAFLRLCCVRNFDFASLKLDM